MRVKCDRCKQTIIVPDEWGGRRVRCLGCNKVLLLPYPDEAATGPGGTDSPAIDLTELASPSVLEDEEQPYFPDLSRQAVIQRKPADEAKGHPRVCPKCGRTTTAPDPYTEILCSHCWTAIPATVAPRKTGEAAKDAAPEVFRLLNLGFFRALPMAVPFAAKAWSSLLPGMLLSVLSLVAPLIVLIAVGMTTGQDEDINVSTLSMAYARPTIFIFIVLQMVYFLIVGFAGTVRNIRSSAAAAQKPDPLAWNLGAGSKTLLPLVVMVSVYGVLIVFMALLCGVVPGNWYGSLNWLYPNRWPLSFWIALAPVLALMPMSLVGFASGHWIAGVNPVPLLHSVGRTIGPYLLLVMLMLVVVLLVSAALMHAAAGVLQSLAAGGAEGLGALLSGLVVSLPLWALAVGVGFFTAYLMARWLGLFALIYRSRLSFTL